MRFTTRVKNEMRFITRVKNERDLESYITLWDPQKSYSRSQNEI